jgi:hypothetical protein
MRLRLTAALITVLGTVLCGSAPAAAAVRFAEPGGNGPAATCPQSNPCDIQAAVEDPSVSAGDEVVVLPGDYAVGGDPIVPAEAIDLHGAAGLTLPRIISTAGPNDSAVDIEIDDVVVRDLRIDHTGNLSGGAALSVLGDSTAERVEAIDHASTACSPAFDALIRDSICYTTATDRAAVAHFDNGTGGPNTSYLRNVTAVATVGSSSNAIRMGSFDVGEVTLNARNVVASGGGPDVAAFNNGTSVDIDLRNSNYDSESQGTGTTISDPGSDANQTDAPLFANAAAGNFHQLSGSPTRNAGTTTASNGPLDIDREPRNQESAPDIGADEFDVIAPSTQITGGPAGPTSDPTPTFTFSSDQLGTFQCAIDAGAFGACSGPGASHTTGQLANGAHTFRVRAIDVSSNVDPSPATRGFTTDTTAPNAIIDKGPKKKTRKRKAKFRFSSDDPTATFECKLDKEDFEPCTSPKKYKKLKRKKHTFQVRATDAAGNVDQTPDSLKWKVKKKKR